MDEFFFGDEFSIEKRKNKKRQNLDSVEIKKLASEIKKRPVIWDLSNKNHFKPNAIKQAWQEITIAMKMSESECKRSWTSLRESHRYRIRAKKQKTKSSGSVPVEELLLDDSNDDWEYSEDLAFLPDVRKKSKILNVFATDETCSSIDLNVSDYSYISQPSTSKETQEDESITGLVNNLNEIVKVIKTESNKHSSTLKYDLIVRNIDRMLQKLPSSQIEDINFEIISLIYKKLKENKEKNITE